MEKRNKGNSQKQAYTYIACAMAVIFLVSVMIPLMSGGDKKKKSSAEYKQKAYDLARLPFDEDGDEQQVLQEEQYQDIATDTRPKDGLYTEEEKQKRQETDKIEGVPVAPDADYKEAAAVKAIEEYREQRRTQYTTPVTTSKGSLQAGASRVTGGTGGTGMTHTWRKDDRNPTGGNSGGAASAGGSQVRTDLLAKVKGGRSTVFFDAVTKSSSAANEKDSVKAASGATEAFQKGGGEADKAKLEGALEKDATADLALDPEAMKNLRTANNNLDKKADEALKKDKQNQKEANVCPTIIKSSACFFDFVVKSAVNIVTAKVTAAVTGAQKKAQD
jgi:hypothetical protein